VSQSQVPLPSIPADGDAALYWIGSSEEDLAEFPDEVKRLVGFALRFAQRGAKHPAAEPLKGYTGSSVLEVIKPFDGNTFRAIYTVRLEGRIYVLHCFQKKAHSGIATPKKEMDILHGRLKQAEQLHKAWLAAQAERKK
jgi:phage-related protein